MQWGTVADWVGALGGLLAVVAAVVAWAVSRRLLQVEERRDAKADSSARREQAELVFVLGAKLLDRTPESSWSIFVDNGSNKPIYDICVQSQRLDGSASNHPLNLGALPPGRFAVPSHPTFHWGNPIDLEQNPEPIDYLVRGKGLQMIQEVTFSDATRAPWSLAGGTELTPRG